ncbi:hypothetical protein [Candidatus Magnetobacterium casense]|uniref:Magnetosome protein Man5 n=1 Tax=Candidatus Magnetobacterium casense TaxID=1455061 RepID=A0ABS6RVT8_9BACT|nr:hypothetical protein [Candidatus Magnetobacterium casensis]MBV6340746.1 hypothetical protein [Candidatus Magnetobacterium casensis]
MVAIRISNSNGSEAREFDELNGKSRDLSAELEELIAEFNRLNATIEKDGYNLQRSKSELAQNDLEAKAASDVILNYRNKKAKLGDPDEILKELDFLDKRLSTLQEDERKLKADISKTETNAYNDNLDIGDLKTRLQALVSSIETNTSQKESLTVQVRQLQEIAAIFVQAEAIEKELDTLNNDYDNYANDLDKVKTSLSRETDIVESLRGSVKQSETQCKELELKTRGVDELVKERTFMKSEIEFISPQVTTYDIHIRDLTRDLEARQTELNTLAGGNAQSKEKLRLIDEEIAQKDGELQAVAEQRQRRDELAATLEKTLNNLKEAYMDKMILDTEMQAIDNKASIIAQAVRL